MAEMKFDDLDFVQMLPTFMREDASIVASAREVEKDIRRITDRLPAISAHRNVDLMEEAELDELAWEEDVDWYDSTADIEVKRDLLRFVHLLKAKRGTEFSVTTILKGHFGSGWVREWFEYGGKPFYFKVFTDNPHVLQEQYDKFMAEIKLSKNARSVLESVGFYWDAGTMELGVYLRDHMGRWEHLHCGVAFFPHQSQEKKGLGLQFRARMGCSPVGEGPRPVEPESAERLECHARLGLTFSGRRLNRVLPFEYQKRMRKR